MFLYGSLLGYSELVTDITIYPLSCVRMDGLVISGWSGLVWSGLTVVLA